MKFRLLLLACCASMTLSALAIEDILIDYQYAGNHRVDFSKLKGSLKIGNFTDGRSTDNAHLITESDLGNGNEGYVAEKAMTVLVREALVQGFSHGGAELVEADEDMSITGEILSTAAQLIDRQGVEMIQLTLRTKLQLQSGGRQVWQTTLFGRGRVPVSDGLAAAVQAALDRTVQELVRDDYFLMEVK